MFASPVSSKKRNIYENHQQESDYKQPLDSPSNKGQTNSNDDELENIHIKTCFKQSHLVQTPMQQSQQQQHLSHNFIEKSSSSINSNLHTSPKQKDIFNLNFQNFRLSSTSSSKAVADHRRAEVFQNLATPSKEMQAFPIQQQQQRSPIQPTQLQLSAGPSHDRPPFARLVTKKGVPNTSIKKPTQNIFLSVPPIQFFSDQKTSLQQPPQFSKRLFQDSSDDENDEEENIRQSSAISLKTGLKQNIALQNSNAKSNNLFAQFQDNSSPVQKPKKDAQSILPPTVPKKMLSPLFSLLQDSTTTAKRQVVTTQQEQIQVPNILQQSQQSNQTTSLAPEVNKFSVSPDKQQSSDQKHVAPSFSALHFTDPDQEEEQHTFANRLNPTHLVKGKSSYPVFSETIRTQYTQHDKNLISEGLNDQNIDNDDLSDGDIHWDLDLNRRNSEVFLEEKTFNRRKEQSIDLGENEFTRAMPGIRQQRSARIGSITAPKQRAQTLLFQIPESQSSKKPAQQLISPASTTSTNYPTTTLFDGGAEDDLDFQILQTRKQIIEQQDFQFLLKKASSQFLARISPSKQSDIESIASYNYPDRFMNDFTSIQTIKASPNSTVYKCQSNVNGLIYAVKAINVPSDRAESNRIVKEVQSLSKFSSYGFGLLKFYNVWIEEGRLFLVMEHCIENLKSLRARNPKPSESVIRQIIRDICGSLQFLHEKDCSHLGIKPENILLSKKMKFKLADLGLSKLQQQEENKLSLLESHYPYIAPELVGNLQKNASGNPTKADIFSLGAVLYELMTDFDLPKYGPEWDNLRMGRLGKFLNSVKYSASLKNVIKSMLLRNPQLRPTAADILKMCPPDDVHELELKYQIEENQILAKKVEDLLKKQNADKGINSVSQKRKSSL